MLRGQSTRIVTAMKNDHCFVH